MKFISIALGIATLMTAGCATKQVVQVRDDVPENNFMGIVEMRPAKAAHFMNDLQLGPPMGADIATPNPAVYNFSWFYTRGETLGQHLDAWAHRFAYRFESRIPLGYDPYVQSDGSFVGNLYSAVEDLSYFSDEGRAQFFQYFDAKRLRTKTLQITIYEKERFIRIEQRNRATELTEADSDKNQHQEAERQTRQTAFLAHSQLDK